jgi:hypothetical protein
MKAEVGTSEEESAEFGGDVVIGQISLPFCT